MSDDEEELPQDLLMSTLFRGLKFFFVPNNRAKITEIRKSIARKHGVLINNKFRAGITTHIVVDKKVVPFGKQVLTQSGLATKDELGDTKVVDQTWFLDSIQKEKLLSLDDYLIEIPMDSSPKKRKVARADIGLTKSEQLEDSINTAVIVDNPNMKTVEILKEMADEREIQGDVFRGKAYKTAIDSLMKTNNFIKTADEAVQLPGIGRSIGLKIQEIVATKGLKDLERLQHSEESRLLKLFKGIQNVGNVTAMKWIREGMKTLDDLKNRDDLYHNQRLGLEFYDDWNAKIPRDECTIHGEYLREIMDEIDSQVEMTIGGSYRRGLPLCGDIDFIVTKPGAEIDDLRAILSRFIERIEETGYVKCALQHSFSNKWYGGCALPEEYNKKLGNNGPGRCRRVDFLLVPWKFRGGAFIYFTGNNEFNKKIRLRASKRGMTLSENGLFNKDTDEMIEGFDEKKIFEILGVKWREPQDRNIGSFAAIGELKNEILE